MNDTGTRASHVDDHGSKLEDRKFAWIADIDWSGYGFASRHLFNQPVDQIVHVAKRARLETFTIDCDVPAKQRLDDEI